MKPVIARDLLRHLREEGFTLQADGETLLVSPISRMDQETQRRVKEAKADLLAELRREHVERLLDLVPVDPETGLPDLPADEPATARQVDRLRELAEHPAFGEKRERVQAIVERAVQRGLSELAAYGLLGDLGRRVSEHEKRLR